jgi:hypothetical protein
MKIDAWQKPSMSDVKKWLDEDDDYKSYKSSLFPKIDYKPYTIDYQDLLGKNKNDDYSSIKIFASVNKLMNQWTDWTKDLPNQFVSQYMTQPYTSSPENPNSVVNTPIESDPDVFTEYPPTNSAWTEYRDGDFSTLIPLPSSITQCQKALELIDAVYKEGTKIYVGRMRDARDTDGHLLDPWKRSMNTFKPNFKVKLLSRQQTKVEANACEELIVWKAETTLKGKKVLLVVWENTRMAYLRKSTINSFLDRLSPYELKTDKVYSV